MTTETGAAAPDLPSGRAPLAFALAFLVYTLFLFSVSLVPIRSDNDCWWHVKSGQYISTYGLPEHDVFNYMAEDDEWHNHEWLSQVVMWQAWRAGEASGLGGWRGVVLFKTLVLWAAYGVCFLLAARLSRNAWIALLVVVLAVAIGRRTFQPRPPVISNLLLAGQLLLFVAVAEGWIRRRWLAVLPPVIALWTNLHGGWMAAGVVVGAFGADQAVNIVRRRLPRMPLARPVGLLAPQWLVAFLLACLLATLANPYLHKLYELPGRVLSETDLVRSLGELRPPDFFFVIDFEFAVHGAFFLALFSRRLRPRLWEVLIYLFFLHQAIQHVRHLLLFSVMMVPLYTRLLVAVAEAGSASLADWRPRTTRLPTLIALILALLTAGWVIVNPREGGRIGWLFDTSQPARTYIQRNLQYLRGDGYIRANFAAEVCDFIEAARLEGRMFNENNYAGYLIWRLAPEEHRVFSDSRFDIFGARIWRLEGAIAGGVEPLWRELLDEYEVQWLINRGGTGLEGRLRQGGSGWVEVARWPILNWQVWIRDVPDNAAVIDRARREAARMGASAGGR